MIKSLPSEFHSAKKGISTFEIFALKDRPKEKALEIMNTMQNNLFPPYTILAQGRDNIRAVDQILGLICPNIEIKSVQTGQNGIKKYLKVTFIRSPYWRELYESATRKAEKLKKLKEDFPPTPNESDEEKQLDFLPPANILVKPQL